MLRGVIARFVVDRPVRPGMVRAILDTLSAQGGAYEPQLVRRASADGLRRITWGRPAGLFEEVAQEGTQTTFLRVSEGQPQPLLSFHISASPRTKPSSVSLAVPEEALATSAEIERVLGICKGLYLFLESPWGHAGMRRPSDDEEGRPHRESPSGTPRYVRWANFFGPQMVAHVGPARLLTSLAFLVEILPDGGVMLVTHSAPRLAETPEGQALRGQLESAMGLDDVLRAFFRTAPLHDDDAGSPAPVRVRRTPPRPRG